MKIEIEKLIGHDVMNKAFNATVSFDSNVSAENAYKMMHSPIRTQEFLIQMTDIPTFVSVHLVRHKIGVEHYVRTNRDDRGGVLADRNTLINHTMKINAESLITLARKRLCLKSHPVTVQTVSLIKKGMKKIDPALYKFMVPECVFRNGICAEGKWSCGRKKRIMNKYSYYAKMFKE